MDVLSALLVCPVMYRRNTCHHWFSAVFGLDSLILSVCLTLALDQQTVGSVDDCLCLVQRLQVVTGIFKIASLECKLSEYFYKAFHFSQHAEA